MPVGVPVTEAPPDQGEQLLLVGARAVAVAAQLLQDSHRMIRVRVGRAGVVPPERPQQFHGFG
ncbi:MAG: hypothetical protein ACR2NB_13565, partial [Solirubrobacteraceae bacterium]